MTIEERLDAVERANKHWQIAVAVLGIVAIIIASLNKLPDTIRVRRLEVVNGRGKPIVEIAENSNGQGQIRILGGSEYPSGEKLLGGKPVVIAAIEPAKLLVADSKGRPIVQLAGDDRGRGSIALVNVERAKTMVLTGLDTSNNGAIQTLTPDGRKLVVIGTSPEGAGLVSTHDPTGKVNAKLSLP